MHCFKKDKVVGCRCLRSFTTVDLIYMGPVMFVCKKLENKIWPENAMHVNDTFSSTYSFEGHPSSLLSKTTCSSRDLKPAALLSTMTEGSLSRWKCTQESKAPYSFVTVYYNAKNAVLHVSLLFG